VEIDCARRVKARKAAPKTAATPRIRAVAMAHAKTRLVCAVLIGLAQVAVFVVLITMDLIVQLVCKVREGARKRERAIGHVLGQEMEGGSGGRRERHFIYFSNTLSLPLLTLPDCDRSTCSGHGTCQFDGSCACNESWAGPSCATLALPAVWQLVWSEEFDELDPTRWLVC
jgi:hypothetical protein